MSTRILTTHVGSLPRSAEATELVFAAERGDAVDPGRFDSVIGAARPRPANRCRQVHCANEINGLAAARTAGVDHDQLAEIMTHAVRRHYQGTLQSWWTLVATQRAEPGRRWPLETVLIDDDLQQPLGEIARGFLNVGGLNIPWEELSNVLSAPGAFTHVGLGVL